jgi:tRNA threonylcarbamoyladenosine biosynthesis protein TsaE
MYRIKEYDNVVLSSPRAMIDLAEEIAAALRPGDIVYLYGELGSGKTVFAKGLCRGLGVKEEVTSSSFVIISEYAGAMPVIHIDLYRLDRPALDALMIDEYIISDGITIIEWADRLDKGKDPGLHIRITINKEHNREISIEDLRD